MLRCALERIKNASVWEMEVFSVPMYTVCTYRSRYVGAFESRSHVSSSDNILNSFWLLIHSSNNQVCNQVHKNSHTLKYHLPWKAIAVEMEGLLMKGQRVACSGRLYWQRQHQSIIRSIIIGLFTYLPHIPNYDSFMQIRSRVQAPGRARSRLNPNPLVAERSN